MFGVTGMEYERLSHKKQNKFILNPYLGYGIWSVFWLTGHILGGAAIGMILGGIGSFFPFWLQSIGVVILALNCLVWALHQLQFIRLPMPQIYRQVAQTWMRWMPFNFVALGYGLQLGCGVATRIKITTTYALFFSALLSGSIIWGGLIMAAFGLVRGILPLCVGPFVASPQKSFAMALAFDRYENYVGKLNGFVLLSICILLIIYSWQIFRS